MDWLDLLAVQGTLKSLLHHNSSKASILRLSAFLMVQLSHPYMTTGKSIALTIHLMLSNSKVLANLMDEKHASFRLFTGTQLMLGIYLATEWLDR